MAADPDSIARYEAYRQADPGNPRLLLALGDLYHAAGRFDEALATFDQAASAAAPHDAVALSRRAAVLLSLHRFAEAEAALQPLADAEPEVHALAHNLGLALIHQHKFDAARMAFERACAPGGAGTAPAWLHLARAHHHLGDLAAARQAASRATELAPSTAAEGYLAVLEFDSLEHDSAYRRARATLGADPDNVDAAVVSGVEALEQLELERADALYDRAARLEPRDPRAWVGIALVRLHRGETARAVEAFERALSLQPASTGTLVALGWTHLSAGHPADAEQAFRRAIAIDGNFGEAHGGLASALVMQNRREEAGRAITLARRLAPAGFGAVYAQSVLLGLEGRQALGARLLDRALERSPRPGLPPLLAHARLFIGKSLPGALPPPRT